MNAGSQGGAVAAGHELTVKAARYAFDEGGNAVDAAIAAAWMACAAEPALASPGGGGFAMVAERGRAPRLSDFFAQTPREKNPAKAEFYEIQADFGTARQTFHIGLGSTATPGFVPGLFALHEAYAALPMRTLLAPAATVCRAGLRINAFQAYLAGVIAPILTATEGARAVFAPDGRLMPAGSVFRNPGLARFMELLAAGGYDAYVNDIIPALLAGQDQKGHLREEDLLEYEVFWRRPLEVEIGQGRAWLNPPPAASGVMVALAAREMRAGTPCPPCALARALHAADEARRACGHDPAALMARLGPASRRGTTHISTIDKAGLACALTISNGEGNGHVVGDFGFMLNNMLGETDVNPRGGEDWPENVRLSSMMAPTLARAEDGALHVLGSGGSNRIRSVIFLVLQRLLAQGLSLREAIDAPRLHVEGGHLDFEPGFPPSAAAALAADFPDHRAWEERNLFFGGCHAVSLSAEGAFSAHGDARRHGAADITG